MSITVEEKFQSRPRSGGVVDLVYILKGSDDDLELRDELLYHAPDTHDEMPRQDGDISLEQLGNGIWMGTVPYGASFDLGFETGEESFTFNTSGGIQHITHSLAEVASFPSSAPASEQAIGATADGVEGCDIPAPIFEFDETHVFSDADITAGYKRAVMLLTGTTNLTSFRGFSAGEVLFLGAQGYRRAFDTWLITFRFAASLNVTDLTIGSIGAIAKKGWDFLDVRYRSKEIGAGADKVVVQVPHYAYTHQVFYPGDWSGFGI